LRRPFLITPNSKMSTTSSYFLPVSRLERSRARHPSRCRFTRPRSRSANPLQDISRKPSLLVRRAPTCLASLLLSVIPRWQYHFRQSRWTSPRSWASMVYMPPLHKSQKSLMANDNTTSPVTPRQLTSPPPPSNDFYGGVATAAQRYQEIPTVGHMHDNRVYDDATMAISSPVSTCQVSSRPKCLFGEWQPAEW
jgi:hypothetical protein